MGSAAGGAHRLVLWSSLRSSRLAPRQIAFRAWRGSTCFPADARGAHRAARPGVATAPGRSCARGAIAWRCGSPCRRGRRAGLRGHRDRFVPPIPPCWAIRSPPSSLAPCSPAPTGDSARRTCGPASRRRQWISSCCGEDAFARDAWLTAERHYLRPSSSTPPSCWPGGGWAMPAAGCRSGPTRPIRPVSWSSRGAIATAVPEVDRHLIEAQFRPSGAPRFEQYEQALLAVASDDPYAPLLYGDELFHRGPSGRPLHARGGGLLDSAVSTDSAACPGMGASRLGRIRLGDRERAGLALSQLERWAAGRRSPRSTCPRSCGWPTPSASATRWHRSRSWER